MTTLNLSNVRLILDAYSRKSNERLFGMPFSSDVRDGFSTIYSITEERYKISENYKIGLVGNELTTYSQDFYQCDLKTIIESSENPYAGFYQLAYPENIVVGDLIAVPVSIKNTDKVLFEIPYIVIHIENDLAFVKPVIELFQKPLKKSFCDLITKNKYWDCHKIDISEITQKLEKLDTKTVMPGYQDESDEKVA